MLGNAFAPTMRAAQAGDERAFARLWRDANPLLVRYLRVIGVEDPYDSACEGWIAITRGVNGFKGDEKDWRLWVCRCARMCAREGSLRSSWSPFTSRNPGVDAVLDPGLDEITLEDLMEPGVAGDPRHRDVNATIHALRALPLGQGEVVDLRYGWGLPPEDVAGLIGLDSTKVRRAEARALERLETPADLLEWSLNAPATPAELADERIARAVFRSTPRGSMNPVGRARIIALGTGARPSGASNRAGRSCFGMIHRNTYINGPTVLNDTWQTRTRPDLFFAGQVSGVEGYVESAASGLIAGRNAALMSLGREPKPAPRTTAIGALAYYVSHADPAHYNPTNITFGIMPPLDTPPRSKNERQLATSARALDDLRTWLSTT